MGLFNELSLSGEAIETIDWDMTPDMSFSTFESWGGRERVRNNHELIYYFFIDNWGDTPKLCLMERGVKHALVLAEIKAPQELLSSCVNDQGKSSIFEKSYAINKAIRAWLESNVVDTEATDYVTPLKYKKQLEEFNLKGLHKDDSLFDGKKTNLPSEENNIITDDSVAKVIKNYNFSDEKLNPHGKFENYFIHNGDLTVTDASTGLMWQRAGLDINSMRTMKKNIINVNKDGYAGYHDWRLPTLQEAMSIMEQEANEKDIHLHSCFSKEQPFIITSSIRKPGGNWFVDYKQGRCFWSSGTIPGGFGRLVRS